MVSQKKNFKPKETSERDTSLWFWWEATIVAPYGKYIYIYYIKYKKLLGAYDPLDQGEGTIMTPSGKYIKYKETSGGVRPFRLGGTVMAPAQNSIKKSREKGDFHKHEEIPRDEKR